MGLSIISCTVDPSSGEREVGAGAVAARLGILKSHPTSKGSKGKASVWLLVRRTVRSVSMILAGIFDWTCLHPFRGVLGLRLCACAGKADSEKRS